MAIKGSRARLKSFLQACTASGELVDVYRSPWLKRALRHLASPPAVSKHSDFMAAYGGKLEGAYLLLALDPYRRETLSSLPAALPITRKLINQKSAFSGLLMHNPDFILLNQRTSQALAFGLGRKNRDFLFALADSGQPEKHIRTVADFLASRGAYKRRFTALDKAGAVSYLLQRFQETSAGWQEMAGLPISAEEAGSLLASKPRGGVYRNEWDEEYSRAELLQIRKAEARAGKLIDKGEAPFRALFSNCECLSWELNTGDN